MDLAGAKSEASVSMLMVKQSNESNNMHSKPKKKRNIHIPKSLSHQTPLEGGAK